MSVAKRVVGRPVLIAVLFALLGIVSLYILSDIGIDLFPETDNPMLMVRTTYTGASPESVEKTVTRVLESTLTNLSGLSEITSTSSEGSSIIRLQFNYGTDLESATNNIRDKLDQVRDSLPDDADSPRIFKFDPSSMPILRIAVRGNRSAEDLKQLAEDYIQPRLEQVDGVAEADVSGGRTAIVRVDLSQNRLDAYGLTITGISTALAKQNVELGGGSISEANKNYLIRTTGEFKSIEEIRNAVVSTVNGYGVKLSDLGTVYSGYDDASSAVYINGQPGVYISIQKQSGSNSVTAADAVYAKMEDIARILPSDVKMEVVSDDTTQIRSTLNNLLSSALEGAILAMAILFLFLRSIKSTIIIGISIPFSILVTLLAMFFAGITLNMMTMTGLILGVGMIVDASIVILENIYHYRERGAKPRIAAILGSQEMISAIVASNLTTIVVFIPVVFFKNRLGMIGQIFQDMVFTIVAALLSSLLVAIFLVPVLASRYFTLRTRQERPLKNKALIALDRGVESAIRGLTGAYRKGLAAALKHRPTTALVVVGFLALSFSLIPRMNISLIPFSQDDSVTLNVTMPIGTTLDTTEAVLLQFQSYAQDEIKGVKSIITSVGTGGMGRTAATYSGSLAIQLPVYKERIDSSSTVKTKLRSHFKDFPNATFSFSMGRGQRMAGSYDIDVAIRTEDLDSGMATATELVSLIKEKVPEVIEPTMDMTEGLPEVEVVIDRQRAYDFGVTAQAVAAEIKASVNGATATTYRSGGNEYSVKLYLQESDRSKIPDLDRIYVTGTSGRIAVANFATLQKSVGPVSIARENQSRIIHVTGSLVKGNRADRVETKIKAAMDENMVLPDGVTASFEGSWKDVEEQGNVFLLIVTMALLLVFGVMAGQYESFKDPFINLFTIPLIAIGVIGIHVITGQSLTMFTAIGVVMLVGIVVNNGIVLVDYTNLLVRRGMPVHEACLEGGTSRLRPVLMTTLTTILGLIPMAFFPGENSEMIQPIGLTVIGGLTSSTLITLFFIPVIYSFFNERRGGGNGKEARA